MVYTGDNIKVMVRHDEIFVDVREPEEFAHSHVQGAVNLPLSELGAGKLAELPKDKKLVLYCNSGNRSAVAMNLLRRQGYVELVNGINKPEVERDYFSD